jgi:hypothetical protein
MIKAWHHSAQGRMVYGGYYDRGGSGKTHFPGFESLIRFGGTKTFVLNLASRPVLELKQDGPSQKDGVRQ